MKAVDISLRRYLFPNINEDGWKFISALALVSIVLAMLWIPLGFLSFLVTILTFYCFRDPQRITPILSDAIVAPADGLVVSISREKGPDALGLGNRNFTRVCIYSSLFDSHINRIPLKGKIHKPSTLKVKIFPITGIKMICIMKKQCFHGAMLIMSLQYSKQLLFAISVLLIKLKSVMNIPLGNVSVLSDMADMLIYFT